MRPLLRPEDDGKFVAFDIDTGDYEIDADDYAAVMRLRNRKPGPEIWLERAGQSAAYKFRHRRLLAGRGLRMDVEPGGVVEITALP